MKAVWLVAICVAACFGADEPRLVIDSGGHQASIHYVAFTRDGRYVVSAGDDKIVRVWDVKSGKTVRTIRGQVGEGNQGKILAAALSPDNRYLAVGGFGAEPDVGVIRVHDFQSGEVVALLKGHVDAIDSLAFSPDGHYLASGGADKTVRLWDVLRRTQLLVLSGHDERIYAVAFSPDGERLVSASDDKTLRLWEVRGGKLIKGMTGHRAAVRSAVFSPNGDYIASGSDDQTLRLWNARTGEFVKQLAQQDSAVRGLSFSPDGTWLLTGAVGTDVCNVFSVPSGKLVTRFAEHKNIVLATAFSLDGKRVATAGGDQHEIYIWSPRDGKIERKLAGDGRMVWSVGFAPNSRSIAFGTTARYTADNNRGPLEKTILLSSNGDNRVSLGGEVVDASRFARAWDRYKDYSLETRPGKATDRNILAIKRSGRTLSEIVRDSTAGFEHTAFSFTPDGRYVASGGGSGFLALYSIDSGTQTASCMGHTAVVWAVAVSPDGRTLVSGSADQTVRLWDLPSCRNLLTIFAGEAQEWVAWTPQGYYSSSANGDKYIGWHINQGLDQQARFYPAAQFQKQFYRPDIVAEYLRSRDIDAAVKLANDRRGGELRSQPALTASDVTAMLPPMISISSPERDEMTVSQKLMTIRAEVLSNTLPIADVKVLLNGIQIAGKSKGSPGGTTKRRQVELDDVELQDGQNILSIIASNEKAMSEPETRKIYYRSGTGSTPADKPMLILVAVGISQYERPELHLNFADADAASVEAAFKAQERLGESLFREVKTRILPNDQATREDIIKSLDWLNKQGTQKDLRILFLSGHGDVDARNNYYFFSYKHDPAEEDFDLQDVPWDLLIRKLTSAGGKSILLVDSCHAAAVAGRKGGAKTLSQIIKELQTDNSGLVIFAASSGSEVAAELDSFHHGAFTEAVIEGLIQGKAPSHDGIIQTHELGSWIIDRVSELTGGHQHAIYSQPLELPSFPIFRVQP